jgi:hypothetical protein
MDEGAFAKIIQDMEAEREALEQRKKEIEARTERARRRADTPIRGRRVTRQHHAAAIAGNHQHILNVLVETHLSEVEHTYVRHSTFSPTVDEYVLSAMGRNRFEVSPSYYDGSLHEIYEESRLQRSRRARDKEPK